MNRFIPLAIAVITIAGYACFGAPILWKIDSSASMNIFMTIWCMLIGGLVVALDIAFPSAKSLDAP